VRAFTLPLALAAATALAGIAGSAQAAMYFFTTTLAGSNEVPANASAGTGSATLLWDDLAHTATYDITFSGLTGTTIASHTHSRTPGQPGPNFTVATTIPTYTGFPLGVTAGTYHHTFDTTAVGSYNPAYVTAWGGLPQAETALLAGLNSGTAYLNIHTTDVPSGEIRGIWAGGLVPEPASWALMIAGFGLAGAGLRRRRAEAKLAAVSVRS
jgi:hypothetical protein